MERGKRSTIEVQFLYPNTIGRVTGEPRQIEDLVREGWVRCYVLHGHFVASPWVKNILMNPLVNVRVGNLEFTATATATALDAEHDSPFWEGVPRLAREKYGWREGLRVELAPLATGLLPAVFE